MVRFRTSQPTTVTAAKTSTSGGMPSTYESRSARSRTLGTVTTWVRPSVIWSASPRAEASMARVAMKGTIPPKEMSRPLTRPQPTPTTIAVKRMPAKPYSWVATVVAHTEERATMAPTDRSMPPEMITKVTPTVTMPITDAWVSTSCRLRVSRNASGWVMPPMRTSAASTPSRVRVRTSARPNRTRQAGGPSTGAALSVLPRGGDTCCVMTPGFLPSRGRVRGVRRVRGRGPRARRGPRAAPVRGRRGPAPRAPRWRPAGRRGPRRRGAG